MNIISILNPENVSEKEAAGYEVRTAVRAVVFDKDNNVAVLFVSKKKYHKLPGGGVEAGEDVFAALKRECREELGCEVDLVGELGEIIEYRKIFKLKQISPCYIAKVKGEKGAPAFTPDELADEFQIKWLPLEQAISLLSSDKPETEEGKLYIVPRDKTFLELAKIKTPDH